ncbi:MAG: hypothetical protein QW390_01485 [Candidatus Bathyarchaeia archaeon]
MSKEKNEESIFTDEELEEMFKETTPDTLHKIKVRLQDIIQRYPLHTIGLAFAFGLLIGVATSGNNGKKE